MQHNSYSFDILSFSFEGCLGLYCNHILEFIFSEMLALMLLCYQVLMKLLCDLEFAHSLSGLIDADAHSALACAALHAVHKTFTAY